jgi:hypothetical protein
MGAEACRSRAWTRYFSLCVQTVMIWYHYVLTRRMQIDCVFVYPGRIDTERFKVAVSKTLAAWPHLAGRLLKTREGTWKVCVNIYDPLKG